MLVAQAFSADGTLIYTRGGFTSEAAATAQARLALGSSAGAWAVVDATMHQFAYWVMGDHSAPVSGVLRASGGARRALAAHWPTPKAPAA